MPLRFSSELGDFALDLTLVTDKPLDTETFADRRKLLKALSRGYVQLVNLYTLKPLPEQLADALGERAKAADPAHWYVNRIQSQGVNPATENGTPGLQGWDEDLFFRIGGTQDELPGFWYYADQDIPFLERLFREHAMAVFFGAGLLFFASLFIKTRINRKRVQQQAKAND
ncbi:MAG: hypothetical protein H6841_01900 [Planctomycetes bacterium]|nr:hypothetical protein [Planctomycetota bacterium]